MDVRPRRALANTLTASIVAAILSATGCDVYSAELARRTVPARSAIDASGTAGHESRCVGFRSISEMCTAWRASFGHRGVAWTSPQCIQRLQVDDPRPFDEALVLVMAAGYEHGLAVDAEHWVVSQVPGLHEQVEVPRDARWFWSVGLVAARRGDRWFGLRSYELGETQPSVDEVLEGAIAVEHRAGWLTVRYTAAKDLAFRWTERGIDMFGVHQGDPVRAWRFIEETRSEDVLYPCARECRNGPRDCDECYPVVVSRRLVEWESESRIRIGRPESGLAADLDLTTPPPNSPRNSVVVDISECRRGDCETWCHSDHWYPR